MSVSPSISKLTQLVNRALIDGLFSVSKQLEMLKENILKRKLRIAE